MKKELNQYLFWDVNVDSLDEEIHSAFIIQRVSMKGRWTDWKKIISFYGSEKVKSTLISARYLDNKTLSFASCVFEIPITIFRCYSTKQLNQQRWNY